MDTANNINKKISANRLTPTYPTHPGEILKDEIEYRGISQRKLAALNVDADPLMRLQLKYNMQNP